MFVKITSRGPLSQQIYRSLRKSILVSHLRPGERLPATRALASELGVSRNVVLLAYEQLMAEGYLVGRIGSGTYVAPALPEDLHFPIRWDKTSKRARSSASLRLSSYGRRIRAMRPRTSGGEARQEGQKYDFRQVAQPLSEFPHETWRRLLFRRARAVTSASLDYAPAQGYRPLREAISKYLRRARGVACDSNQVVVVSGSQQALDLLARVLLEPGECVAIEEPHYLHARQCFEACGARMIPVPVDDRGLAVERLPRRGKTARLVYVTPSHQFPTGAILPLGRRLSLLTWAQEVDAFIVEDDYDSEFRYEGRPIEAIQGLDRFGRVIYVGSFSKLLFPALRIGYLVVPPPLVEPIASAKLLADRHSPTLLQEVLAEFIESGGFERHLRRCRKRFSRRREVLLKAVGEHLGKRVEVMGTNAGLHVLLWFRGVPASKTKLLLSRAARAGVGLYSVSPYYLQPPARLGVLLRYACMTDIDIRRGIKQLAAIIP